MDYSVEDLARMRLEETFGTHAREVLHAGAVPPYALQLRLQEVVPSTPRRRHEPSDPEAYLQAIYHCQQQ